MAREESMFYVILRTDDNSLYRHTTLKEAIAEATRLADKHLNKEFIILKAKYCVRRAVPPPPPPVEVIPVHRFTPEGSY